MSIESLEITVKPEYDANFTPEDLAELDNAEGDVKKELYTVTINIDLPEKERIHFTVQTNPLVGSREGSEVYIEQLKSEAQKKLVADGIIGPSENIDWPEPKYLDEQ